MHQQSSDWRVVIYLTLDHPPPAATAWKYTNGDVSTLPYSYTLSPVPHLLRQPDGPVCRTHTIPASAGLPYPALPMDFPGLMTYLQAALGESRRAAHDRSGGAGRLAKMVEECFPEAEADHGLEDPGERRSGKGFLNRVFKRKSRMPAGGNQETYQLITPFLADDVA